MFRKFQLRQAAHVPVVATHALMGCKPWALTSSRVRHDYPLANTMQLSFSKHNAAEEMCCVVEQLEMLSKVPNQG